jgi:hypothetical protein
VSSIAYVDHWKLALAEHFAMFLLQMVYVRLSDINWRYGPRNFACPLLSVRLFLCSCKDSVVQNHLGHINKTHLRDLLKDKERCEGMIKYVNLNSHGSYHIIENLLSQVTGDGSTI